jgi:hypothetical protein
MNTRWTVSLAAGTAVFLCGAVLATAAEPSLGQNQTAMQSSPGVTQNLTLTGPTAHKPQTGTYTVARPIDQPEIPSMTCPPVPCVVPQPCTTSSDPWAGWSEEQIEFSSE